MPKVILKKLRYIPLIISIKKEFNLTSQQSEIYGYLFNHCMNLNDDGYCGYSDQHIADELDIAFSTFKRELTKLKEKKLIIVKNSGKRTKKKGESRMIYINTEVYMDEVQMDTRDIELENAKKQIKALQKQIEELKGIKTIDYTIYVMPLLKLEIIEEKDYQAVYDKIGPLYYDFAILQGHGMGALDNHIKHIATFKGGKIENPVAYLTAALRKYAYNKVENQKDIDNFGF